MLFPPAIRIVIPAPVPMLDPRRHANRRERRRHANRRERRKNRFGKQSFWDGYHGLLSPKQMRESGL